MIDNIDDVLTRRHTHPILENEKIELHLEDEKNEPVPLVYDKNIDFSLIKNVLLVHDGVQDHHMFVEGANHETFSIVYNIQSTQKELKELLKEK